MPSRARGRRKPCIAPPASPPQHVDFPLPRPILGLRDQRRPHGILPHIRPLLAIMLSATHLRVPAVRLPTPCQGHGWRARLCRAVCPVPARRRLALQSRLQSFGDPLLQIPAPPFDRHPRQSRRRTKKMNMIRHHHVPANAPRIRIHTCLPERRMHRFVREKPTARPHRQRHEQDYRLVMPLDGRRMNRALSFRQRGVQSDTHVQVIPGRNQDPTCPTIPETAFPPSRTGSAARYGAHRWHSPAASGRP